MRFPVATVCPAGSPGSSDLPGLSAGMFHVEHRGCEVTSLLLFPCAGSASRINGAFVGIVSLVIAPYRCFRQSSSVWNCIC
jgi:hypothetical protein